MTLYKTLSMIGSLASILGFFVSVYVLIREYVIESDVNKLTREEEAWHKNDPRTQGNN